MSHLLGKNRRKMNLYVLHVTYIFRQELEKNEHICLITCGV
jgi:hypothetical protein